MGRYLRRITPGEVLPGYPSEAHNAFYDHLKAGKQALPRPADDTKQRLSNRIVVSVFNETGAAITADFPVLEITAPVFTPDDRENVVWEPIAFNGETPTTDSTLAKIVVVQGPMGTADRGRQHAVLSGPTWVDVQFSEGDDSKEFAGILADDNTQLVAASSGFPILWKPTLPDPEYLPASLRCCVLLGGGAEGSSTRRRARVVAVGSDEDGIAAATSNLESDWGVGWAVLLNDTTGEEEGDPIEVVNPLQSPDTGFDIDFYVEVDTQFNPAQVYNGSCEAWTWSEAT